MSKGREMFKKIKRFLGKTALFIVSLWPAMKLFLRWPIVAVSIAAVPVQTLLSKAFPDMGPVTARFMSVACFVGVLWLAYTFAEVVVPLVAIAFVMEIILMRNYIKARIDEWQREQAVQVVSFETPSLDGMCPTPA